MGGACDKSDQATEVTHLRIALLTPYTGSNLGDAVIQDALIANMRLRLPGVEFSGITQNCENFLKRHGDDAFPLCGVDIPFFGMAASPEGAQTQSQNLGARGTAPRRLGVAGFKRAVRRVPWLGTRLKVTRATMRRVVREVRHCLGGYRLLRRCNLLIVSGGGQLSGEWGGAWGHPYALFKWAVLARLAGVPFAITGVGASTETARLCRFFLSTALRLGCYRSFRSKKSRQIAADLLPGADRDAVVPDLAFSLPLAELPPPAGIRSMAQGRRIIAISLIATAKPGISPMSDRNLYDRYLVQMASLLSQLVERGYFLAVVGSCLWDTENVLPDLLDRLDDTAKKNLVRQMTVPPIATWKDLVAALEDADYLVASRLHSAILGFMVEKPTVAISSDPKVDSLMEESGQNDYLLNIHDFSVETVIAALNRLDLNRDLVVRHLAACRAGAIPGFERQYNYLADLCVRRVSR